ncbi:NAD(P)-dependent oxidoreductase [Phenylobacterium sp.]|jgi:phosphoglycerate dehydrogenase-like enzyme|uniref:NAD(P)-dependent oxidoreductase n=1 Tax=Phenylobacterium sp. TaxID=1871053 RepID=UPI002E329ACA|nr:NAD(P)-dependent oxidoreductase [Phenylobacterium sp.]HEX4710372.1 NAD(P)-dependent oxidoreductase [Phenylobacterium sp.]
MQILMTKAAYGRVADRLPASAPHAEVVTAVSADTYECNGRPIAVEDIDPEVVWLSLDSFADGTLGHLFGRLMKTEAPRWTQIMAAGIDNPMFRSIMEKGVRISKSSAQATPIAEYVVAHALSLQLPIQAQADAQRRHAWERTPYRELGHTRWVLVGYGNIGHEIAKRIRPFGVHLTVVRRNPAPEPLADRVVGLADFRAAAAEADVVALACALNDETRGLCDEAFFRALKPGAILINIGRGGLVDEDALKSGLDRDQPAHAVLDVFATEPLPADSWFWDHPKVRVSAHTSNSGDGNLARGDDLFLENLRRYLAKEPLLNEADPSEVGLRLPERA